MVRLFTSSADCYTLQINFFQKDPMRQDAYKVVHETSRAGKRRSVPRGLRLVEGECLDDVRQSMRKRYWPVGLRERQLKTNVLRRFLASRVGQPWAEVYSEMSQALSSRDKLLTDPLRYASLATNTDVIEGETVCYAPWGGIRPVSTYCDFYVDPKTGLLQSTQQDQKSASELRKQKRQAREAEKAARVRVLSEWSQLHQVDGIWYEVALGTVPSAKECQPLFALPVWQQLAAERQFCRFDALLGRRVWYTDARELRSLYGRGDVYAMSKRQLNHRELKEHGLLQAQAA